MNRFKQIVSTAGLLLAFLLAGNLHAQVPTVTQDSIINSLTQNYTEKLVLTGKQEVIFKEKLQTFYLEKEQLRQEMKGEDKLRALYELGKQENGEMRDVLTQEQFDLYLRTKPSLQPLEELSMKIQN
ncbi:hypothetical protein [Flavimarina sp. Hel_I_48]|uniref:hypothetical protein n=1 Tax=Flavimarina sp. Hel_I_48 TaxID=1392488 RepID=UPI0004DFCC06|nr:hypothetical protein [Flavimarina sp. Hel_I_48]